MLQKASADDEAAREAFLRSEIDAKELADRIDTPVAHTAYELLFGGPR